jgi:hypothetical protein
MVKQYFDVSSIKLDETGRTVLSEERLAQTATLSNAGAGWLEDWWDRNGGSCRNTTYCDEENNTSSCSNVDACFNSSNAASCTNNGDCDYTSNFSQCSNTSC